MFRETRMTWNADHFSQIYYIKCILLTAPETISNKLTKQQRRKVLREPFSKNSNRFLSISQYNNLRSCTLFAVRGVNHKKKTTKKWFAQKYSTDSDEPENWTKECVWTRMPFHTSIWLTAHATLIFALGGFLFSKQDGGGEGVPV